MVTRNEFLYPRSRYHGQVKPENLIFNANLQEFAQRASYIANLETGGKLSAQEAYEHIKILWIQFEFAYQQLKTVDESASIVHDLED